MFKACFNRMIIPSITIFLITCVKDHTEAPLETRVKPVFMVPDVLPGKCPEIDEKNLRKAGPNVFFTGIICVDEDKECPDPKDVLFENIEPFVSVHSEALFKWYVQFDSICKGDCEGEEAYCVPRVVKLTDSRIEKYNTYDHKSLAKFKEIPPNCSTCEFWISDQFRSTAMEMILTLDQGHLGDRKSLFFESILNKDAPWGKRDHKQKCCSYKITNLGIKCGCAEWPVIDR